MYGFNQAINRLNKIAIGRKQTRPFAINKVSTDAIIIVNKDNKDKIKTTVSAISGNGSGLSYVSKALLRQMKSYHCSDCEFLHW